MGWIRKILSRLLLVAFGFFLSLCLLEFVLCFFPVASPAFRRVPVNDSNPLVNFEANEKVIYSLGWNFYQVSHKRTNNWGFYNDANYKAGTKIVEVIGDSYVEALQLDNNETFFSTLASKYPELNFYSFGASGAQLPTYLMYSKIASKHFKPTGAIFVIVSNDFDESFYISKSYQGFQYFDYNGNIWTKPYHKPIRRLLGRFHLMRYLYLNLKLGNIFLRIRNLCRCDKISSEGERYALAYKAIDLFFKLLPEYSKLLPTKILFVIDAPRAEIYGLSKDEFFTKTRSYFISKAKALGYNVLDLYPIFKEHYNKYHQRFEFPTDWHWNEIGHKVVVKAMIESDFLNKITQEVHHGDN